jgi:hypothetical protein
MALAARCRQLVRRAGEEGRGGRPVHANAAHIVRCAGVAHAQNAEHAVLRSASVEPGGGCHGVCEHITKSE